MAVEYITRGFVFKKEDRSEADRVFSVFTKDFGRVEVFAKAIRKSNAKLRGNIELFSFSTIEFVQGKRKKTLTDAAFQKKYSSLYEVPEKFEVAAALCRILDTFLKGPEQEERIFTLLETIIESLSAHPSDPSSLQQATAVYPLYFFWQVVMVLGYGPELSVCAICQQKLTPALLFFSYKEGGVICSHCAAQHEAVAIHADAIKILRLMQNGMWETILKLKSESNTQQVVQKISGEYYRYLTHNL